MTWYFVIGALLLSAAISFGAGAIITWAGGRDEL